MENKEKKTNKGVDKRGQVSLPPTKKYARAREAPSKVSEMTIFGPPFEGWCFLEKEKKRRMDCVVPLRVSRRRMKMRGR
jgi:hypothetical protein